MTKPYDIFSRIILILCLTLFCIGVCGCGGADFGHGEPPTRTITAQDAGTWRGTPRGNIVLPDSSRGADLVTDIRLTIQSDLAFTGVITVRTQEGGSTNNTFTQSGTIVGNIPPNSTQYSGTIMVNGSSHPLEGNMDRRGDVLDFVVSYTADRKVEIGSNPPLARGP